MQIVQGLDQNISILFLFQFSSDIFTIMDFKAIFEEERDKSKKIKGSHVLRDCYN